MTARRRVVLADDHLPTRAGVRAALEDKFKVCAEASDADGAVAAALRERPDVCVLDVHMPGGGIEACERILAELPDTAVVMLTVSQTDEDLFASLRAGACGYLLKDTNPDRLPFALEGVLNGEAAVPRTLVARVIAEYRGLERRRIRPLGRREVLSEREREILRLMGEGRTTAQIAAECGIAPVTVRRHIASLLHKLKVPDRKSAIALVQERGV